MLAAPKTRTLTNQRVRHPHPTPSHYSVICYSGIMRQFTASQERKTGIEDQRCATRQDDMKVYKGSPHSVTKRFTVDGNPVKIYDPVTKKSYDYAVVKASFQDNPKTNPAFVFEYHNDNRK
jgi:hypothetical protein